MKRIFIVCLVFCAQWNISPNAYAGEGHEAGDKWAEEKGIDDPSNCQGNSQSFREGCLEHLRDEGITNDDDEIKQDDEEDEDSDE